MPYDARYAVMSVRKKSYGNQGGTTGYMSRPFWGGAFLIPKYTGKYFLHTKKHTLT